MSTTPYTPEQLVKLIGTIDEWEDDESGQPEHAQYVWFSKLWVWQPGKPDHGWAAGTYPSPYPNDDGFVIKVFESRSIIRMSSLTPGVVMDVLGMLVAPLTHLDHDNLCYLELEDGLAPVIKHFSQIWLKHRSDDKVREPRCLNDWGANFIGLVILGFSHTHMPELAGRAIDFTVRAVQHKCYIDGENRATYRPDWTSAVEEAVTHVAFSVSDYKGKSGFRARPFKKMCSAIIAGYAEKLEPGTSIGYSMDSECGVEHEYPEWIGNPTSWSHGFKVPLLDQRAAQIKIERMMRRTKIRLPSDACNLINAFAYGSHKATMDEQAE